jgi:hypothetical protein
MTRRSAVPAHEDTVEFQAGRLNVRHDQDRPAGFEQRRFEQKAYKRRLLRPRLRDNTQIEAARDLSQHAGRPGYGRVERMGAARDRQAAHGRIEARYRSFDCPVVLLALGFEHLRRNPVHVHHEGHERSATKRNPGQMRFECGCDGSRKFRHVVGCAADGKIDDDVLDHGSFSIAI